MHELNRNTNKPIINEICHLISYKVQIGVFTKTAFQHWFVSFLVLPLNFNIHVSVSSRCHVHDFYMAPNPIGD